MRNAELNGGTPAPVEICSNLILKMVYIWENTFRYQMIEFGCGMRNAELSIPH